MKRDHVDSTQITLTAKGAESLYKYQPGTLLMVTRSGILRRLLPVAMLMKEATVNQDQKAIVPFDIVLSDWLMVFLKANDFYIRKEFGKAGTTVESVVFDLVKEMPIALPPIEEQKRIIDDISELLPLIDKYGELEDTRERLDAELPDRLRKSILQMAVRGKLVEQDPADEPASVLLERIRAERAKLVKEKKLKAPKGGESVIYRSDSGYYEKRGKGEAVCIDDEIPYEIPGSWIWVRLGDIGDWKAGATPAKGESKYYEGGSIPWLLTGDLTDGLVTEVPRRITEQALRECSLRINPVGSVLVAMYGATIGKIGVLGVEATTNQACCACVLHDESIREWLVIWLRYQKPHFIKKGEGGAQPNISRQKIVGCLFPLPPLDEQKRIVERCKESLLSTG